VRYFGGILLGKGGLIRAYGKAAGLAIDGFLSATNDSK
jgi:putative IMPACT (imprinted ancient) family translation regulator